MGKEYSTCICRFIPDGPEIYSFGRDITPGYAKAWWGRVFGRGFMIISPREKPFGAHIRFHAGQKTIWQRWFYR